VTTKTFLELFGFTSLRDLPDLELLDAEGLLQRGLGNDDLNSALGLTDEDEDAVARNGSFPNMASRQCGLNLSCPFQSPSDQI
jgi:hypothetical protein